MTGRRWRVVLGALAERDFAAIVAWTAERFGERQADVYRETLVAAMRALEQGPTTAGARARDEILVGLRSLHVARGGRRGRHFIIFRVVEGADPGAIQVVRILHDAMDLARQIRDEGGA